MQHAGLESRGTHRGGAGRRARQWRSRAPRRLLHRFTRDSAIPGDRLRPPLRIRHLPPEHRKWLADRAARRLAAQHRSVGGEAAQPDLCGASQQLTSCCRAPASPCSATALEPARHRLRPAGGRLRRPLHQYAAPVGGRRTELARFCGILPWRLRRRGDAERRRRVAHPRALSGRFHARGPGFALPAAVFPRELLSAGHHRALPRGRQRLVQASRPRGHPDERHAPGALGRGADAAAARRGAALRGATPGI